MECLAIKPAIDTVQKIPQKAREFEDRHGVNWLWIRSADYPQHDVATLLHQQIIQTHSHQSRSPGVISQMARSPEVR